MRREEVSEAGTVRVMQLAMFRKAISPSVSLAVPERVLVWDLHDATSDDVNAYLGSNSQTLLRFTFAISKSSI
ncbi:hypothetical protein E2C01_036219 [Portunus trituberculatus]|uniref:Uncharacterized protein n=1 Tax=Portunus trituberculatus TaxID=210409 RepID=A0A5B7FBB8_PORTR|nr:hypothetical protein [Portunus trituberculatus]